MSIIKIARHGSPSPVEHHAWRELIDDFDISLEAVADTDTEEAVVDLWLEDPQSFMEGMEITPAAHSTGVRRVPVGGTGLHRGGDMTKTASASSWDQDFADAKEHAASVLKNIGSIR